MEHFRKKNGLNFNGEEQNIEELQDTIKQLQARLTQVEQENDQLRTQVASLKGENKGLLAVLAAKQQPVQQENDHHYVNVSTTTNTRSTDDGPKNLADRYYALARDVMGNYQDQVKDAQTALTQSLLGHSQTEFLKLEKEKISPTAFKDKLLKRNDQLVRYIENHGEETSLINQHQKFHSHHQLRGITYWGNFTYLYHESLDKLLKLNQSHRHQPNDSIYNPKEAKRVVKLKPSYLSEENIKNLRTIYHGLNTTKEIKQFQQDAEKVLKGGKGEQKVEAYLKAFGDNKVLTSLNLPYQYRDKSQKPQSNQIDNIVVNKHGIFILEIKNFNAKTLGIDEHGEVYGKTANGGDYHQYKKKITKQGYWHREAVLQILQKTPYYKYLKYNVHVIYVSANNEAKLLPSKDEKHPYQRFYNLDDLHHVMKNFRGNLYPKVIDKVTTSLVNAQIGEREYEKACIPDELDERMEAAFQQYQAMQRLLKLNLDDLIKQRDPTLMAELEKAGLQTANGYVFKPDK